MKFILAAGGVIIPRRFCVIAVFFAIMPVLELRRSFYIFYQIVDFKKPEGDFSILFLTGFRCRGVSREESRKRICNGIKSMYKMLAVWYNAVTEKLF